MKKFPRKIGVIHLPALLGAPRAQGVGHEPLRRACSWARNEAAILVREGFDGLILENFGDVPFFKDHTPPETIAAMAVIVSEVRAVVSVPIGVNLLRNDGHGALAVATTCGAQFIRVNVLSGVYATDQGLIEGNAAELMREKLRLRSEVKIFADVHVKHATPVSSQELDLAIEETALRAGADAIIVTGTTTGRPVDRDEFGLAVSTCAKTGVPLYVGSGVTPENCEELMKQGAGVIIGSHLRQRGVAGRPLDLKRLRQFKFSH